VIVIEVKVAGRMIKLAVAVLSANVALITTLPATTPCAAPLVEIFAVVMTLDVHVLSLVTKRELPSAYEAVATYCCIPPIGIELVKGEMESATKEAEGMPSIGSRPSSPLPPLPPQAVVMTASNSTESHDESQDCGLVKHAEIVIVSPLIDELKMQAECESNE
jgi:hypothetical protein